MRVEVTVEVTLSDSLGVRVRRTGLFGEAETPGFRVKVETGVTMRPVARPTAGPSDALIRVEVRVMGLLMLRF